MKTFPVSKKILYPLLVLIILQFACSFGAKAPAANPQGSPANSNPAPSSDSSSNGGQIVVTGVVNKTVTPAKVYAMAISQSIVGIFIQEQDGSTISLAFPSNEQPGTYPIDNRLDQSVVNIAGMYDLVADTSATYFSTKGTLTLTAVGPKYSGQFEFDAGDNTDATKTINVTGSFTDVPSAP